MINLLTPTYHFQHLPQSNLTNGNRHSKKFMFNGRLCCTKEKKFFMTSVFWGSFVLAPIPHSSSSQKNMRWQATTASSFENYKMASVYPNFISPADLHNTFTEQTSTNLTKNFEKGNLSRKQKQKRRKAELDILR